MTSARKDAVSYTHLDVYKRQMSETAEALTLGPDGVGKYLADVDPDNSALGKREECDVPDQRPDQQMLVGGGMKDGTGQCEA